MKKTNRRSFMGTAVKATLVATVGNSVLLESACSPKKETSDEAETSEFVAYTFTQVKLPYDNSALEPNIDAMTMDIHYNKHHAAYVRNINDAISAENINVATPEALLASISSYSPKARNNAGGAWNHNLYWEVMRPGGSEPSGKILDAINGAFESFDKFKEAFTQAAMSRFGSGWAWLVNNNGTLTIGSTPNQDNPLMDLSDFKGTPLLGIDVWEHAYYLNYQNKRNEYVANWWNVVNWDAVAARLG